MTETLSDAEADLRADVYLVQVLNGSAEQRKTTLRLMAKEMWREAYNAGLNHGYKKGYKDAAAMACDVIRGGPEATYPPHFESHTAQEAGKAI